MIAVTAVSPSPPAAAADPPVDAPSGGYLRGTSRLVRLALRRDRVLLPGWIVGLAAMVTISVFATRGLYPDDGSLQSAAELINATTGLVAVYGKVYATTSFGAVALFKLTAFGAAVVAVFAGFVTVRHTRAEEESGRLELVAAGDVGRFAPLAAALTVAWGASLVLGAVTALGLAVTGLPVAGCLAFGATWASSGLVFSAVAAVAAQVTTSARAALGASLAAVGAAYVSRALGDVMAGDPGVPSWLSPIGWSEQIRPFAGDRWQVAALPAVLTLVLAALAGWLRTRRDLGAGLLPSRPGPAVGALTTTGRLAWRLQRGSFLAWLAAAAIFGLVLGSAAASVGGFFESTQMRRYLAVLGGEQAVTDAFLAAEVALISIIICGYAIAATLRLRAEESAGHLELLFSSSGSRRRVAAGHVGIAALGSAAVLLTAGVAIGAAAGLAGGEPSGQVLRLSLAAAAHIPAIWVMVALTFLAIAWWPRLSAGIWLVLIVFVVLGEFGTLWQLPDWLLQVSPFAHSPTLPGGEVSPSALLGLVAVAAAITACAAMGWRHRDIE